MDGNTIDFQKSRKANTLPPASKVSRSYNEKHAYAQVAILYRQLNESGVHPDDFFKATFKCLIREVVPNLDDDGLEYAETVLGLEETD